MIPQDYIKRKADRNDALYPDGVAKGTVITMLGRTGAPVVVSCAAREDGAGIRQILEDNLKPAHRSQTKFIATDKPNVTWLLELKKACPNLIGLTTDPLHLVINYEMGASKKQRQGSFMLRRTASKHIAPGQ